MIDANAPWQEVNSVKDNLPALILRESIVMGVRSSKLFWSHDAGSCWGLEEYEFCNKLTFRLRDFG